MLAKETWSDKASFIYTKQVSRVTVTSYMDGIMKYVNIVRTSLDVHWILITRHTVWLCTKHWHSIHHCPSFTEFNFQCRVHRSTTRDLTKVKRIASTLSRSPFLSHWTFQTKPSSFTKHQLSRITGPLKSCEPFICYPSPPPNITNSNGYQISLKNYSLQKRFIIESASE